MATNAEKRTVKKLPFLVQPTKVIKTIGDSESWSLELISKGGLTPSEMLRIDELAPSTSGNKQQELADKISQAVTDHNLKLQNKIIHNETKLKELKKLSTLTAEQSSELYVLETTLKADKQNFVSRGEVYLAIQMYSLQSAIAASADDLNLFNSISDPDSPRNKLFIKIYNVLPQFFISSPEEIATEKEATQLTTYAHIAVILSTRLVQSQGDWTIENVKAVEEETPNVIKELIKFVSSEINGEDPVTSMTQKLRELKPSEFKRVESQLYEVLNDALAKQETVDIEAEVIEAEELMKSPDATAIAA